MPTFPRANYYVQEGELEHAHEQHERDRVSYMTDNYDPLVNSGQMQLLQGDAEIAPGISVKVYPGHTRDLQAVIIRSGDQVLPIPATWYPMPSISTRPGFWATTFILWRASPTSIASTTSRFRRNGWSSSPTTTNYPGPTWRSEKRGGRWRAAIKQKMG